MKTEIIYPIFLNCYNLSDDIIWKKIFENLSYGITPPGIFIKKNFLYSNYNKNCIYKIDQNKNEELLFNEIYNLFKFKFCIFNQKDKIIKQKDLQNPQQYFINKYKKWTDIKKKSIKDLLIEKYIINMKKKYNLSYKQAKYLLSYLFLALTFKMITSKDIEYKNGIIEKIVGIDFTDKNFILHKKISEFNFDTIYSNDLNESEPRLLH